MSLRCHNSGGDEVNYLQDYPSRSYKTYEGFYQFRCFGAIKSLQLALPNILRQVTIYYNDLLAVSINVL